MKKYNLDMIEQAANRKHKEIMKWLNGLKNNEHVKNDPALKTRYEQYLGAELASSITSEADLNSIESEIKPYYSYKDGSCYFEYKGVRFTVADLRSMRESPRVAKETYFDICVVLVDRWRDDVWQYDILPTYCCGSTTEEFDEGQEVHDLFIEAADEYLEKNPEAIEDYKKYKEEFEEDE